MILFSILSYFINVFFIWLVYQDMSNWLNLQPLNYFQILMIGAFLSMVKMTIFGIPYADMQAHRKQSNSEKAGFVVVKLLAVILMTSFYYLYKYLQ